MAVMVILSDPSDGTVNGHSTTYATARSTGATLASPGAQALSVGQWWSSPNYDCFEAFLSFDTSLVSNPTSALLSLADSTSTDLDFTVEARLYDWGTSLTVGDFVAGASLTQTLLATYDTVNGWTTGTHIYRTFADVAMVANLNLAGFTRILLNSDRHRLGTTPASFEYVQCHSADQVGTSVDPKLTIDNDTGDPGGPGPVPDDDNVIPPFQQTVSP